MLNILYKSLDELGILPDDINEIDLDPKNFEVYHKTRSMAGVSELSLDEYRQFAESGEPYTEKDDRDIYIEAVDITPVSRLRRKILWQMKSSKSRYCP